MGRALFSQKYASAAPIRTEPQVATYTTWSRWNPFDPDSNEFFIDAEREVFTDTPEYQRELEEHQQRDAANPVTVSVVEPPSFERTNSAPVQPITSGDWQDRFLTAGATSSQWEHVSGRRTITEPDGSERVIPVYISSGYRSPTSAGFAPATTSDTRHGFGTFDTPPQSIVVGTPSSHIAPSHVNAVVEDNVVLDAEPSPSPLPPSPTFRRMVDIEIPASPSPDSPASPSTPTDESFEQMMFSPSSPPSAPVQPYSWDHHHMAPSRRQETRYTYRESHGGPAPRLRLATSAATRGRPYAMITGRV